MIIPNRRQGALPRPLFRCPHPERRTDKTFAIGLQFHPEAALVKHLENADNRNDFMDYDTALSIFRWIVQERYLEQDAADAA